VAQAPQWYGTLALINAVAWFAPDFRVGHVQIYFHVLQFLNSNRIFESSGSIVGFLAGLNFHFACIVRRMTDDNGEAPAHGCRTTRFLVSINANPKPW
jgi:hypothetical protein